LPPEPGVSVIDYRFSGDRAEVRDVPAAEATADRAAGPNFDIFLAKIQIPDLDLGFGEVTEKK
jgi:hypothetical protein